MADRRNSSSTSTAGTETDDKSGRKNLKFKGIRKRKWGKWVSEIRLPNCRDRIWLGSYDKPEQAARAFDAAQFCLRGPHAKFNFPDTPPVIDGGDRLSAQEIQAAAAKFAAEHDGDKVLEERTEADGDGDVDLAGELELQSSSGAVVDGGGIWPVWDMLDGGSDFGFGNEMIYDGNINFPVQENMEFVDSGGYFCHDPNFLWNFDNH